MEDDTIHVDQNFLEPSADLEALVGTLLVAINDQLLADESHAEWSMAAWQRWLDDEGYPIHEAIDQFYNQVASSYSTELESLKSELIERLNEPNGLELLDRIIDSQRSEITENLHDFIDQAVSKANESYRVAGGTHTKAIVGGTVGLLCFTVGIGLKIRNNKIKRVLLEKAKALQSEAEDAFDERVGHIEANFHRQLDQMQRDAKKLNDKKKINQVIAQRTNLKSFRRDVDRALIDDENAGKVEIILKQDLKSLSEKEFDFMVDNYAKSLANQSLELMKRSDQTFYKQASERFKNYCMVDLFKDRRYFLGYLAENNEILFDEASQTEKEPVVFKRAPFPVNATEVIHLKDFNDLDEPALKMADEKMHGYFASALKDMTKKALKVAVGDEAAKIKLSFKEAYDEAKEAMKANLKELSTKLSDEDQYIRRVLKNKIAKADQKIANEVRDAEGDIKITIE